MSDDEFMMEDAADEEYDFDYDDDDDDEGMDEQGGDVENQYYKAKSLKEDDAEGALKAFRTIVDEEADKGEWGFKSLKQMTKMNYLHMKRPSEALKTYRELLSYTKSNVTRNYAEKSINNILDYVGGEGKHGALAPEVPLDTLESFYSATKEACDEARNERLSTKSNLKLAKLWLDRKEYDRLQPILRSLHASCGPSSSSSGSEDQTKGSLLLELYAIEIQMYSDLKETRKLKEIYNASMQVKNAIPHPRIMGVIRECGGKMWMMERAWDNASTDLFESFRQYDESGSPQRIQVLKYLVLTYMLMGSEINPFDSQETKPYKNDPQIVAMTGLVSAYQMRDVQEAERILKANRATITGDPFIQFFINDLLRSLRTQYIIDIIKPYTRLELDYLAKTLNIARNEVEALVISLILDRKIKGKIDQVNGLLVLERFHAVQNRKYKALEDVTREISNLGQRIINEKVAGWEGGQGTWSRAFG
ncbi:COP9 signalosome complex subunit 2 [Kockovaella imperatae]|uniref:COP9 signalosome complex subunit 2 n=1 Tax=Kockovaella imperatae TaxID=4999 RepID=A0A1Y1UQB0_9TREE|nr:COP9 signalosome complex subunit 2 [Kockovaella imperatae]ORX40213.1 COP9 signalosome complex subunit 2 [Kockovaella imperatae]